MWKKAIVLTTISAMLITFITASVRAEALDWSYWSNQPGTINYTLGTITMDVPSVPDQPWRYAWGKTQSVTKDKVYAISFDARALSHSSQTNVPISLRLNQNYSPWGNYSAEETINLTGTKQHYTVKLYSVATDANTVLGVWLGHSAASYEFANISVAVENPSAIIETHPLDNTYWTNQAGAINYAYGTVNFNVPTTPDFPWRYAWGKTQSVTKDKVYVVSFDAKANVYPAGANAPVSLRLNQNYSPWSNYSKEEIVYLNSTKQHYTVRLYSVATDANTVIGVWCGHSAASYEFSNISVTVENPSVIVDAHPLDQSYWTNQTGSLNYAYGTITMDVPSVPDQPWRYAWGKTQSVTKDKVYAISFDARALSHSSQTNVPISLRLNQNYSPWGNYSAEETINLTGTKQHYTVKLYSVATDANTVLGVWLGHSAASYEFANISVAVENPSAIIETHPLDNTYWTNQAGAINYAYGTVNFNVPTTPDFPWRYAWGKTQSVTKDKVYVVSFDAKANVYPAGANAPVSLRLNQNYSPWSNYSKEEIVYLNSTKQHYTVRLYSVATDANTVIGVWCGHSAASYEFSNISVTVENPSVIVDAHPLDQSYWTNQTGSLNYAYGTITMDVPSVPDQPWRYAWGKTQSVTKDKVYAISFDARALSHSSQTNVPISLRLNQNYSPWGNYSAEETINLTGTKQHYTVKLYSVATDANTVLGVWLGHSAASYEFANISVAVENPSAIIETHPLDNTYWTNQAGAINYAYGTVNFNVPTTPDFPWRYAWGKTQSVTKDKVYVVSFDAKANVYPAGANAPVSLRLNQNYSPWSNYSKEEIVYLNSTKQHYTVRLYSVATDANTVIGVWCGHSAASYEFSNISVTVENPSPVTDTVLPQVTAFSANPTALNAGQTVTAYFTVTDNIALVRAELWRAGYAAGACDDAGKDGCNWNAVSEIAITGTLYSGSLSNTPPAAGTYYYGLHAIDAAGNVGCDTAPVKVTVDNAGPVTDTILPQVTAFSMSPTVLTAGNPTTANFTVTDNTALAGVELWRGTFVAGTCDDTTMAGCIWSSVSQQPISGTSYSGTLSDTPAIGTYYYGVHVYDTALNINWWQEAPVKVTVDNAGPVTDTILPQVTAFSMSPTVLTAGNPTTANFTVTDNTALAGVELWRGTFVAGTCDDTTMAGCIWSSVSQQPISGTSYSGTLSDTPAIGTYYYGVHVYDTALNINWWQEAPVKVTVTS